MLLRHVARPMLATWFVYDGVQAAVSPQDHVRAARRGVEFIGDRVGFEEPLSEKQVTRLVRAHGAATAAAGLLLAVGKAPRAAALTLAALTVPLAVVNQPFTSGTEGRAERTSRFVANVGTIGAALIAGADYEGRPGVQWRLARARHDLALAKEAKQTGAAASAKSLAASTSREAAKAASRSTRRLARTAGRAARRAGRVAHHAGHAAHYTAARVQGVVHDASSAVHDAAARAQAA